MIDNSKDQICAYIADIDPNDDPNDDRPTAYNNLEPVFITADTRDYQLATSGRSAEELASEVVARAICECFDRSVLTHD